MKLHERFAIDRRLLLGTAAAMFCVRTVPAQPLSNGMREAIRDLTGGAKVTAARVKLEIPEMVENGNAVSLVVSVTSPMTAQDRVESIHIFNERNPQPHVINFRFGAASPLARVSTRVRLADTQTVVAIARMKDGSFWSASVDVIVTVAACVETL